MEAPVRQRPLLGDIQNYFERRIRALRRRLAQLNVDNSGGVRSRTEIFSKALVPGLLEWAVRRLGPSGHSSMPTNGVTLEALGKALPARGIGEHGHPFVAIGIAVGTGFLIGLASIVADQLGLERAAHESPEAGAQIVVKTIPSTPCQTDRRTTL